MSPELITIILNVVFFAFLLLGFLFGLRGLKKATSSLISFVVAMIVVLFLAYPVSNWVLQLPINGTTLHGTIAGAISSAFGESIASNEVVSSIINGIPVMLVSIVVCLVLIAVIGSICKIITSIIYRLIFGKNKEKVVEEVQLVNGTPQMTKKTIQPKKHRLLGGLVGFVHGFLLAVVTFMPIIGIVNIVNDVAGTNQVQAEVLSYEDTHKYILLPVNDSTESNEGGFELKSSKELLQENLPAEFYSYASAIDNSLLAKIGKIGNISENTLNLVARCDINGQTIKLGEEIRVLVGVYDEFVQFATEASNVLGTTDINAILNDIIENPNNYDFEQLYVLCDDLFKSNLIKALGNDAMLTVCDTLAEHNTNVDLTPIYSHLKTAVENYIACGYNLKDDLKAVLQTVEISAKTGLIKQATLKPFSIDNLASVLLNEADGEKKENENLNALTAQIASSNLLQKIVIEATNYGSTYLQDFMNENIAFDNDETVVLPKINGRQDITISSEELSGLVDGGYDLYGEYKQLDTKKLKDDILNIFNYDVKRIINLVGEELENITSMALFADSGLFANICEAMSNSEYSKYLSFEKLVGQNDISSQFANLATSLDEIKQSNIIDYVKTFRDTQDKAQLDLIIDELAVKDSNQKTLASKIVEPVLSTQMLKNTLVYALGFANDAVESVLANMTENPDLVISEFNTTQVMTQSGNVELLNIINNFVDYAKDIKIEDLTASGEGANDVLIDTLLTSNLPVLGATLDSIKQSTLFSTNGTDNGAYKDIMLALNESDLGGVLDFAVATNQTFSWSEELTLLDSTIDTLNTIKIGEDGLVNYMLKNTDFDGVFDALKQDDNKEKVQSVKTLFELSLVKPVALTLVNTINTMVKDFVGETLGAQIVDITSDADLASQSQQITNVLACVLEIDFNETNLDNIDSDKLNALLEAMEANASVDGVFKESYNALLLKVADMVNENVKGFVGDAGSNITRITTISNALPDSDGIIAVLLKSIDTLKLVKDKQLKDISAEILFELIDEFKTNKSVINGAFENTYNSLLVYIINTVNSEISSYVGSTFNTQIVIYNGSTNVTDKYNLIKEVAEKGISAFASIPEGKELKDIDSEKLSNLLDASSYLTYTQPAYNALNNKLANTVIESINSLTGDSVATLTQLKDLTAQADDIFTVVDISLKLVPLLDEGGLKVAEMSEEVKTGVAGFMNALQLNSLKADGVFKASYESLINKVATENGVTSEFIYQNFATNGIIDWSAFVTSI